MIMLSRFDTMHVTDGQTDILPQRTVRAMRDVKHRL